MPAQQPAVTLSVRVPPEVREQLEALSDATGRTKSFLASEAIAEYVSQQAWQVAAIEDALQKADNDDATFIDHDTVMKRFSPANKKSRKGNA